MVTSDARKTISAAAALLFVTTMSVQAYLPFHLATEATLKQLEGGLNIFELQCGRYPSQSEGLSVLVTGPTNRRDTNFVSCFKEPPQDPWGRAYVYRFPAVHNPDGPDLYTWRGRCLENRR